MSSEKPTKNRITEETMTALANIIDQWLKKDPNEPGRYYALVVFDMRRGGDDGFDVANIANVPVEYAAQALRLSAHYMEAHKDDVTVLHDPDVTQH